MRIVIYKDVFDWIHPIFQLHVRPSLLHARQIPQGEKFVPPAFLEHPIPQLCPPPLPVSTQHQVLRCQEVNTADPVLPYPAWSSESQTGVIDLMKL